MYLDNTKLFYYEHDLDSIAFKYGRLGGPQGYGCPSKYGVVTAGSSTTITAAAGTPFDPVSVGDMIVFFIPPDTRSIRKVMTKTSGSQISVNTAIDLGVVGVPFDFYPFRIGTEAKDGWHHTQMYTNIEVNIEALVLSATGGVDYSVEILSPSVGDPRPIQVASGTLATATTEVVPVGDLAAAVRVGLKGHTDFAGTDVITVWLQGEMRSR